VLRVHDVECLVALLEAFRLKTLGPRAQSGIASVSGRLH
jgi:hypothetical protein